MPTFSTRDRERHIVLCLGVVSQALVSSQNTMPQLNQLFKPGAVITARITKEDVSQEAQFDERNQRR
jgi:hypothetical protein